MRFARVFECGPQARLSRRVVVPSRDEGIADEDHLGQGDAQEVAPLPDAVCLVDPRLGHVDRCRAAHANRELREGAVKDRLDRRPLGEVGVPPLLLSQGSLLAQGRQRDLASPVLDDLSPDLGGPGARQLEGPPKRADDPPLLVRREVLGVDPRPVPRVPEELRPARRQQEQVGQSCVVGQRGEQLLLELRPASSGDHGNLDEAE